MNILDQDTVLDIYHIAPYFKNICPLFLESQKQTIDSPLSCTNWDETIGNSNLPLRKTEQENSEKVMMEQLLVECKGKVIKAAQKMGISRQLFHYRMKRHGLVRAAIVTRYEKETLEQALEACQGNLTQTAKKLGISLQLLNYKMKKFL